MRHRTFLFTMILALSGALLFAAPEEDQDQKEQAREKATPRESVTHHTLTIGSEAWKYKAIAGDIILEDGNGLQKAAIFSISYILEDSRAESRPITFLFNGGPGSSAVWLHLGAFGPGRIGLSSDPVNPGAPPYRLEDNPHTLLRYSDPVFVDPVGTGYSRALGEGKDKDFWCVVPRGLSRFSFVPFCRKSVSRSASGNPGKAGFYSRSAGILPARLVE